MPNVWGAVYITLSPPPTVPLLIPSSGVRTHKDTQTHQSLLGVKDKKETEVPISVLALLIPAAPNAGL